MDTTLTLTHEEVDLIADGLAAVMGRRNKDVHAFIHNHPEFDILSTHPDPTPHPSRPRFSDDTTQPPFKRHE